MKMRRDFEIWVNRIDIAGGGSNIGRLEFVICKVIWLIDLDMLYLVRVGANSGF